MNDDENYGKNEQKKSDFINTKIHISSTNTSFFYVSIKSNEFEQIIVTIKSPSLATLIKRNTYHLREFGSKSSYK